MRALLLVSSGLVLLPSTALAQTNVDAERLKPAVTHDGWVNAEGSAVRPTADPWEFGAFLNYARNPLVVVNGSGDVTRHLVSGHAGLDLFASVTLAKPFAVGLDVPLYVAQTGDYSPSFGGLGDMR